MIFAGFGIVAPEYGWNDYAGLDVKGKTVVVLVNDPGLYTGDTLLFKGREMTYYGRWTYKYEEAARQGAAGVMIIHETEGAGYPYTIPTEELNISQALILRVPIQISLSASSPAGFQLMQLISYLMSVASMLTTSEWMPAEKDLKDSR